MRTQARELAEPKNTCELGPRALWGRPPFCAAQSVWWAEDNGFCFLGCGRAVERLSLRKTMLISNSQRRPLVQLQPGAYTRSGQLG